MEKYIGGFEIVLEVREALIVNVDECLRHAVIVDFQLVGLLGVGFLSFILFP